MKLKPLTILAALALIGVGGFMAGRVSKPATITPDAQGPIETKSSRVQAETTGGNISPIGKSQRSPLADRVGKLNPKDRLARLEAIVRGENPLERNRALLAFLDQLGPGDFENAVAHFRSLGITESRNGEYALLLTAWAQADPLSALTYATENTGGGFAHDTILTSWASSDPEAAIHWAKSNYNGDGPNPYLPGIIRGIAQSDPTRATELLASMPRSEERGKGLDFILPHLLQQGSEATRNWIAGITDEALKNGAMIRVADDLASTDPAGTAAWLIANPGEASQRRMDDVYSAWAQKDQQAALNSFSDLPPGEARSNALRGVISSIATGDPKSAVSLMDQYPNDVNDRVVQNFVWHSFGEDPALALSQVARIGNENDRNQMYRRALDNWLEREPANARAWLQTNPIPDSIRERIDRRAAERQ